MKDVWDLITSGQYEEACRVADEEFAATGRDFLMRNKVFALLCLGRYDEVVQLCNANSVRCRGESASDFILLGVAHWLGHRHSEAIAAWRAAENTKYADAAGGVEMYLLQVYAATKLNDEALRRWAVKGLRKACRRKSIGGWPGPIAQYTLDRINEAELYASITSVPILRAKQVCQAEFHIGVTKFAKGAHTTAMEHMKRCVSQGSVTLLKAEYYLAAGELRG